MKVSVVIPAFNEEKYISKTLKSVNSLEKDNFCYSTNFVKNVTGFRHSYWVVF